MFLRTGSLMIHSSPYIIHCKMGAIFPMNPISQLLANNIKLALLLVFVVHLAAIGVMVLLQHHFHTEEINLLVSGAVASDENYEPVIHSERTRPYRFDPE